MSSSTPTPASTLKKYWGYSSFRSLQEEIINSVLQGKDTLALLPTGGGKSVCFQVPAMILDGVCVVISPLIALMKDQVENLKRRNIHATAIFSGMSMDAVDAALGNCIYGGYKFLYLSPERLLTERVRDSIERMNVSFFAVDEAHCISQWGYDFRPPYLQIAQVRELHKKAPVLALTATATPVVREDIMKKLEFHEPNFFQKSFERKNLAYHVVHSEDKDRKLVEILNRIKGCAIVYVRNRKRTREYSELLNKNSISADFYHAGLTMELRNRKQDDWKKDKTRVMVSTNAFGMGIDKPDVRVVIHMDLPDNPESYYQEAGRAGRDEKNAFAILVYNKGDVLALRNRQTTSFPSVSEVKKVYQSIANYLQIPVDSGMGISYDFDLPAFVSNYNYNPVTTLNCIKILELNGLIDLSDSVFIPSRIHIKVNNMELYRFQVSNQKYDILIKTILRSVEGIFDDFVRIDEPQLANRSGISYHEVVRMLNYMNQAGIISYEPRKDKPQLTLTSPREDDRYLEIDEKELNERKRVFIQKSDAMIRYATSSHQCRSMILLSYFGEKAGTRCGICDYCRSLNKTGLNDLEIETVKQKLYEMLIAENLQPEDISRSFDDISEDRLSEILSWLVEQEFITVMSDGSIGLKL